MVKRRKRSLFWNGQYGRERGRFPAGAGRGIESRVAVAVKETFCRFDLSNSPDEGGQRDDVAPCFAGGEVTADAGFDIGLAGVAFAAFQRGAGIFFAVQSAAGEQISPLLSSGSGEPVQLYEKELEKRVKEILKNVEGVGTVDVMIMLHSSGEKIIHVDQERSRTSTEEQDSSGGTRKVMTEETSQTALMSGSSGSQEPVIEKEIQPEIAGVVISAQGGGSAQVKAEISEAMEALFGLPAHKIKVLKRVE